MTVAEPTPIVETDFSHHERHRREIARVVATLAEMSARGEHVAACHDLEREADGRPRRSRRQSA